MLSCHWDAPCFRYTFWLCFVLDQIFFATNLHRIIFFGTHPLFRQYPPTISTVPTHYFDSTHPLFRHHKFTILLERCLYDNRSSSSTIIRLRFLLHTFNYFVCGRVWSASPPCDILYNTVPIIEEDGIIANYYQICLCVSFEFQCFENALHALFWNNYS